MVTWNEFHTGNPQILCTTEQTVFSRRPGALELCPLGHWGFRGIFCLYLERRSIKPGNLAIVWQFLALSLGYCVQVLNFFCQLHVSLINPAKHWQMWVSVMSFHFLRKKYIMVWIIIPKWTIKTSKLFPCNDQGFKFTDRYLSLVYNYLGGAQPQVSCMLNTRTKRR
jgi:hypothetical protein